MLQEITIILLKNIMDYRGDNMNSFSNILIGFVIGFAAILVAILIFYFLYRTYLNLKIQNKCKKKFFIQPLTFMLLMIIVLLFVVIGISHYNLRELRIENEKIKEINDESKMPVFTSLKAGDHTYDIYIDALANNSLEDYKITKETKNDFEYYFATSNKDIKYMPNYILFIRYIGTEESLNGYIKYSINDNNSFQGSGNVEKEYILLAKTFESLPKSIEIGLSNNINKNDEAFDTIIKFDIKN